MEFFRYSWPYEKWINNLWSSTFEYDYLLITEGGVLRWMRFDSVWVRSDILDRTGNFACVTGGDNSTLASSRPFQTTIVLNFSAAGCLYGRIMPSTIGFGIFEFIESVTMLAIVTALGLPLNLRWLCNFIWPVICWHKVEKEAERFTDAVKFVIAGCRNDWIVFAFSFSSSSWKLVIVLSVQLRLSVRVILWACQPRFWHWCALAVSVSSSGR